MFQYEVFYRNAYSQNNTCWYQWENPFKHNKCSSAGMRTAPVFLMGTYESKLGNSSYLFVTDWCDSLGLFFVQIGLNNAKCLQNVKKTKWVCRDRYGYRLEQSDESETDVVMIVTIVHLPYSVGHVSIGKTDLFLFLLMFMLSPSFTC